MTIKEAFEAGQKAFEAGRARAPALNPEFVKQACAESREPGGSVATTANLLGEYLRGWDRANLDAPILPTIAGG